MNIASRNAIPYIKLRRIADPAQRVGSQIRRNGNNGTSTAMGGGY